MTKLQRQLITLKATLELVKDKDEKLANELLLKISEAFCIRIVCYLVNELYASEFDK